MPDTLQLLAPVSGGSDLDRFRVVLVNTRNSLNMGAAARAMSNFGFRHLRVVRPYEVAFREAQSAVGAEELLADATEYDSVAEAVADCVLVVGTTAVRQRGLQHPVMRLEDAAVAMRQQWTTAPVALLFGSEKRGLSNDDLTHCHWLLRIPTNEENISMNLGQAVAVCLYEMVRVNPVASSSLVTAEVQADEILLSHATAGELERTTQALLESLQASGYLKANAEVSTEERVRRMIRRLSLGAGDNKLLQGMLRQMIWKMKP